MKTIIEVKGKIIGEGDEFVFILPMTSIVYSRFIELIPLSFKVEDITNETIEDQHKAVVKLLLNEEQSVQDLVGLLSEVLRGTTI